MERQPTCEERIDEQLEHTLGKIRLASQPVYICPDCEHESTDEWPECPSCESLEEPVERDTAESQDAYMEGVLEISPLHIVYRVGLSYGGPADGFYLYVDPEDRTIDKIEYYFQDWFDGATRVLHGDELSMVRDVFQPYIEIA